MNFGVWFLKTFELNIQSETNLWFKTSFTLGGTDFKMFEIGIFKTVLPYSRQ